MKLTLLLALALGTGVTYYDSAAEPFEWTQKTPVQDILVDLGEPLPNHALDPEVERELAAFGEALFHRGTGVDPRSGQRNEDPLSAFFTCAACHATSLEDPDVRVSDPVRRLDLLRGTNGPLRVGTTLYGTVNKRGWYNGSYQSKYANAKTEAGVTVRDAGVSLRAAVQVCSELCSQGRPLSATETDALLAYLWTLEYRWRDLRLTPEETAAVERANERGSADDDVRRTLRGAYLERSPATFEREDVEVDTKRGDPARGTQLFRAACLPCHGTPSAGRRAPSRKRLEEPVDLRFDLEDGTLVRTVRHGKLPKGDRKQRYMPEFTLERMSPRQLEDLAAAVAGEPQRTELAEPTEPTETGEPKPADRPPAASPGSSRSSQSGDIAEQARSVLQSYCVGCHGESRDEGGARYDLYALAMSEVTPGNPRRSPLWKRAGLEKSMPPAKDDLKPSRVVPQPSDAERAILEQWIRAGAPEWRAATAERSPITEVVALRAMRRYVESKPDHVRRQTRFFSLVNAWNDTSLYSDEDLDVLRAALSIAFNSLHWGSSVVKLEPIDSTRAIYALDLSAARRRDGREWSEVQWASLVRSYPYGFRPSARLGSSGSDSARKGEARDLYRWLDEATGASLPALRADWFVAVATRPPLYETMLELPPSLPDLERFLGVNAQRNILSYSAQRAGLSGESSGISDQNRLVERHPSRFGAYWKSYDFLPFQRADSPRNLFTHPFGPEFKENPLAQLAFENDGGEMIFHLPNGLMGYYLTDANDIYLDAGPEEVVQDGNRTSGSVTIVNGLSCIGCHDQGVKPFKDEIRGSARMNGRFEEALEALYPEQSAWEKPLAEDERRFVVARDQAAAYMGVGRLKREPVSAIAKRYQAVVSIETLSRELGVEVETLGQALRFNTELARLFRVGHQGGDANFRVGRDILEARDAGVSHYQRLVQELGLGTPIQ